jgi:hypothetical protein
MHGPRKTALASASCCNEPAPALALHLPPYPLHSRLPRFTREVQQTSAPRRWSPALARMHMGAPRRQACVQRPASGGTVPTPQRRPGAPPFALCRGRFLHTPDQPPNRSPAYAELRDTTMFPWGGYRQKREGQIEGHQGCSYFCAIPRQRDGTDSILYSSPKKWKGGSHHTEYEPHSSTCTLQTKSPVFELDSQGN